jgi:membrane-associated protease RseP (regulator of RpoE activity)
MNSEVKRVLIQIALFVTTFVTTTLAGTEWVYSRSILFNKDYSWQDFLNGMEFSIPFLLILTIHEFGHYFTARYHKIKVSLPYYIPVPPLPFILLNIGTFGALIRLRERVHSKRQNFDIGIAGPLAGFIAALIILYYGFTTLPPPEHIYSFHPEYEKFGLNYADTVYTNHTTTTLDVVFGKSLLFVFFEKYVADPARVPNAHEIMHYPILLAGFLSLLFTFLNLLPVGQLDGGHVSYGLFGSKGHRIIATIIFLSFIFYAGIGYARPTDKPEELLYSVPIGIAYIYFVFNGFGLAERTRLMYTLLTFAAIFLFSGLFPDVDGYRPWLLWGFIIGRMIGVQHPATEIEEPLDTKRIILGWLALAIFIVCFSPAPINAEIIEVPEPATNAQAFVSAIHFFR